MVSLLTDYGLADGFVGALHSVLRARQPLVPIVDLTHEVRPQDVRAGSLALERAARYLAPGVVVAIVDPGVGTRRRAIAVRATDEQADVTFVGPDNGLLGPALDVLGGPARAVSLENRAYQLEAPGPTFAGRDVFAPAAAHLAGGGHLEDLGPDIEVQTLVRLPPPVCRETGGSLEVEVTWVDRFGNVQLAAGANTIAIEDKDRGTALLTVTATVTVTVTATGAGRRAGTAGASDTGSEWPARFVHTFGDLAPGELGLLVDSYGSLALCLNGASAARLLGTGEQDILSLRPAED